MSGQKNFPLFRPQLLSPWNHQKTLKIPHLESLMPYKEFLFHLTSDWNLSQPALTLFLSEKQLWKFSHKMQTKSIVSFRVETSALVCTANQISGFNPLSGIPTKWSNALNQFVGFSRKIISVCLTISWVGT